MPAPTRPKIDRADAVPFRRWLRSPLGANLNPDQVRAVCVSSPVKILSTVNGNPLKMWRMAWDIDRWACRNLGKSGIEPATHELATILYDYAEQRDETGAIAANHDGHYTRWRDTKEALQP